ncbi:MAG TPA: hypothetical protein VFT72_06910 [Opitutaceae bacterium]|nr:hypothetical protein [Opitutaceae bacterium]
MKRRADALHVAPEDIAYSGLNYVMNEITRDEIRNEILHIRNWRRESLPRWSDSAWSVHAYECGHDDHSGPGR